MSANYANPYNHLTDSLERDLIWAEQAGNRAYSVLEGLAIVANGIARGATAFGRYLVQVAEALNEARARDARFSGSQW
ncbi:hypothetical protein VRY85_12070 [Achromobacter sp. F4_2707]|uniref:hypothetical protein n=1 Tax=Achromobacter sp. F4_2707 TaxID=3114286 RepID=UPI0039C656FD